VPVPRIVPPTFPPAPLPVAVTAVKFLAAVGTKMAMARNLMM
jgi:hypothetical protein